MSIQRIVSNQWPAVSKASNYKLGIGDTLTLTLIIEEKNPINMVQSLGNNNSDNESQTTLIPSQKNDATISSRGRIVRWECTSFRSRPS